MSDGSGPLLTAVGLDFSYGSTEVLVQASMALSRGVTVLLGANGAGKTTLLRLLAGALRPDSGRVCLGGSSEAAKVRELERTVGFMPQQFQPVPWLSAEEYAAYSAYLAGLPWRTAQAAARKTLEMVGIDQRDLRTSELSGGTQRRLGIAAAVVTGAPILLFDEPTSGLDPLQRDGIHALIRSLGDERGVVVSSHLTEDLDALGDRVLVVARHTIAFEGDREEFLSRGSRDTASIAGALRSLESGEGVLR